MLERERDDVRSLQKPATLLLQKPRRQLDTDPPPPVGRRPPALILQCSVKSREAQRLTFLQRVSVMLVRRRYTKQSVKSAHIREGPQDGWVTLTYNLRPRTLNRQPRHRLNSPIHHHPHLPHLSRRMPVRPRHEDRRGARPRVHRDLEVRVGRQTRDEGRQERDGVAVGTQRLGLALRLELAEGDVRRFGADGVVGVGAFLGGGEEEDVPVEVAHAGCRC